MVYQDHRQRALAGDHSDLPGVVRVSFGCYNTLKEIDALVEMLGRLIAGDYQGNYVVDRTTGFYWPQGFGLDILKDYFVL